MLSILSLSLSALYHATGFYGFWLMDVGSMMLVSGLYALMAVEELTYELFREVSRQGTETLHDEGEQQRTSENMKGHAGWF